NVTPDFGNNPDGNPTLFEANINYTGIKPLTFTVGYTRPFTSLEDATFPGSLLFLERPSIIFIERNVAAGIQRFAVGGYAATEEYFASAYLTGPTLAPRKILSSITSNWRSSAAWQCGLIMIRIGTSTLRPPASMCFTRT